MKSSFKLFTDGGARGNPGPAAYAFLICKMDDTVVEKYGEYLGKTTNNQAEYMGLVAGLERATAMKVDCLQVFMDSELIIKQMNGLYKVKNIDLMPLYKKAIDLATNIPEISFTHIRREKNKAADSEVNRILDESLQG